LGLLDGEFDKCSSVRFSPGIPILLFPYVSEKLTHEDESSKL
jgi:hypothetical protein